MQPSGGILKAESKRVRKMPVIQRPYYLKKLVAAKHNGTVKIVTGIRRCGKSFLLFRLFKEHLLDSGVSPDHILEVDLEQANWTLRNPSELRKYIERQIIRDGKWTYVLIDEIQMCDKILRSDIDIERLHPDYRDNAYLTFYNTLSGLKSIPMVDVYVTGSNSRMLVSDVATEFRGYSVDVGVNTISTTREGIREKRQYEIDFVVNRFSERIYIQSVWMIPDEEKRKQETFSLAHTHDGFRKIVVTGDPYEKPWMSEDGITFMGIVPFLREPRSIETL